MSEDSHLQTKEENSQYHYVLPGLSILKFGTYMSMGTKLQLLRQY